MAVAHADLARAAADLLAARRARDALFGADRDGFGEPAWDILLALFVSDAAGRSMTWGGVVGEAGASPAIAERYMEWLVARDLAARAGDAVELSGRGRTLMTCFLSERG